MTQDPTEVQDPPEELADVQEQEVRAPRTKLRYRTIRFVAFFALLVLTMLTAYRYAMNTEANMWYLFQVARSTAWTLDLVGQKAEVEPHRQSGAQYKRTQLAEWRGEASEEGAALEEIDEGPLTPWESWLHKAYSRLRDGGTLQQSGPTVYFLAKQGLISRRSELRKKLLAVRNDRELDPEVQARELSRLETAMAAMDAEEEALPEGDRGREARRDIQFSFQLVPDCGAIPSISIFLAAVIAFPTLLLYRVIGVVAGTVILYAINVARLTMLAYIGAIDWRSGGKWFNFVHEYVWQGIFVIFVVVVWMAWIEFIVRARRA